MGENHLYCPGEKIRLPECSSCSPGECDIKDSPIWCDAPFDPEGLLATLPVVFSVIVGLHFGNIL